MTPPIHSLGATDLLAAMRRRELSSVEITTALIARRDAIDGSLGAFVHRFDDGALAQARLADEARARGEERPLLGLPITVKENFSTRGTPVTLGVNAWRDRPADDEAAIVSAARESGVVVLGKTNIPQFLLSLECENPLYGATKNPWDAGRSPGGSSGGEGAAIATGLSPLGIASDIGGSIRIPASWCGIVGFKPTFGRWSNRGQVSALPGQEVARAVAGPMARTVADVILAMNALSPELQHRLDPRVSPAPLPDAGQLDVRGLTVGYYVDDGFFAPCSAVGRAIRLAADALGQVGARVVPYSPPRSWDIMRTWMAALSADGGATLKGLLAGDPPIPQLRGLMGLAGMPAFARRLSARLMRARGEARVAMLLEAFGDKPVEAYWALTAQRSALQREELAAWAAQGLDAVLGPATVSPPALVRETGDWALGAVHTMRGNVLDLPSGVQPVTVVRAEDPPRAEPADRLERKAAAFEAGAVGLPIAVQITSRPWEEHIALALMAAVEAAVSPAADFPRTPIEPRLPPARVQA